jgi:hypothetical protein
MKNNSAFPYKDENETHPGMTLLAYFAGQVLAGMDERTKQTISSSDGNYFTNIAEYCVNQAKAIIKALDET